MRQLAPVHCSAGQHQGDGAIEGVVAVVMIAHGAASAVICQRNEERGGIGQIDLREQCAHRDIHAPRGHRVSIGHPTVVVARTVGIGEVQHNQSAALIAQRPLGGREDFIA